MLEREEIYQRVWGYTMAHGDRSVDVFVRKLRAKLQQASPGWNYIHTHFGVGYRFAAEPAVEAVDEAVSQRAAATADGAQHARARTRATSSSAAGEGVSTTDPLAVAKDRAARPSAAGEVRALA